MSHERRKLVSIIISYIDESHYSLPNRLNEIGFAYHTEYCGVLDDANNADGSES